MNKAAWHPLTASQTQFWKGHALAPDAPIYNMAWRFELSFELDPGVFCQSFLAVAHANDAMSAVIVVENGVPQQGRSTTAVAAPKIHDFSEELDARERVETLEKDLIGAPFDLGTATYRTALVKVADAKWVWIFVQHHIVCDAQSGAVLVQAVSDQYQSATAANAPSFFDFAQRILPKPQEMPQTASTQTGTSWQVYGVKAGQNFQSERAIVPLDDASYETIEALSVEPEFRLFTPDLTRFAILLTAYAGFLHRVSGDEILRIGIPAHNRLSAKDRETLGLFVEVLPIELTVDAEDSFTSLFAKTKTAIGGFLRTAKPNAILAGDAQKFDHVLNHIQVRFGTFAGHPLRVIWQHSGAHDAGHGLRFQVMDFDGSERPELALDINSDICAVHPSEQIAQHFARFLQGAIGSTETVISKIALTGATEAARIVTFSQAPEENARQDQTLVDLLDAQVCSKPNEIAVQCRGDQISYAELWSRSGDFAANLGDLGVASNDAVIVHMHRSIDMMIAVIGIMRAGAVFVPVASTTPVQRLHNIALQAGAKWAVTDEQTQGVFDKTTVVECAVSAALKSSKKQLASPDPSALAYLLYTSGSTGVPKGVAVSHQGVSRYIQWAATAFGGDRACAYALFSSISFDLTITSMFAPLINGGRIVVYPENGASDMAVLDVFGDDDVDVVKLTPSHLALVCAGGRSVSRIKTLVLGGEDFTTALAERARSILSPTIELINEYGPTEAVVGCMIHRYEAAHDTGNSVPIGAAADGVSVSIRNGALAIEPFGVVGEICVGGRLSNGYHNADDLTSQTFVTDPLSGQTIYRTGDLGRLLASGTVEYLGRRDQQLKIGGVRVEVAEIEHALHRAGTVHGVHVMRHTKVQTQAETFCVKCGISSTYPSLVMHDDGVCDVCKEYETYKDRAEAYFEPVTVLEDMIAAAAKRSTGKYDVVMLLSGGKDSTYAAYRLSQMTSRVLALTLDNGYISDEAKANVAAVSADLGWDHRYLTTEAMNAIFVDSLQAHSNVCQGCFKTVYTLAMRTARDEGIAAIVTGLSRGQFFETRLTPDLFKTATPSTQQLDAIVRGARQAYHTEDDAIARLLKTDDFSDGSILREVEVIDLYRYIDVPVSEIFAYLSRHTPWHRPSDTGRSTNCLINDVGIYVHKKREGFHNYALPYSWDVRMGHKTRAQAMEELDDTIDTVRADAILDEIGFDTPLEAGAPNDPVVAYVAASADVTEALLWDALDAHLPRAMHPNHIVVLEALPLTANGKVDVGLLPRPGKKRKQTTIEYVAATTDMERTFVALFEEVLGQSPVGINDDFFDLGVESLAAITLAIKANEAGIPLPATALFTYRTIATLAEFSEQLNAVEGLAAEDDPLLDLDEMDMDAIAQALS